MPIFKEHIIPRLKKITPPFVKKIFKNRSEKIRLIPSFVRNGKLLEIGCAYGKKMEKLNKLGWTTYGIEMHEKSAQHPKKKKKLNVRYESIEDVKFHTGKFDAIIMDMVLEHLYNPFESLKIITEWLKPNGQLLFSIPYFNGIEFSFYKEFTYALHLPHHITFFNKKILKEYLTKLGYKNIKFYFHYFDRDIVASAQYKYADTNKFIYKFIGYNKFFRKFFIKPFVFITSLLGKTSRVSVFAEKN